MKQSSREFQKLFYLLLVVFISLMAVGGASAQANTPTDDQVNAIARQLYCPVCENVPLDVCGTQACAQWRELIREKLAEGWSETEIKTYFVNQYGARVLATPPASGFNWLAYIVPPLAFIAGVFFIYRGFAAWHKPVPPPDAIEPSQKLEAHDEYLARLEEELKKQ